MGAIRPVSADPPSPRAENAMEETNETQTRGDVDAISIDQVYAEWLAAGAKGDAETMRRLRRQHPQWLDLDRVVGTTAGIDSAASVASHFCSWEHFHLDTIGASALHTAAWERSVDILEMLLEAGQDPDTRDDGDLTAMMVSILHYNVVVVRCIFRNSEAVRRNIVVDCRDEDTKLQQQILAAIKLLLRFGADVNARNQEGFTALHYIASGDALEFARFLLGAGADIDARDQNGKTPLHLCIHDGSLLVANFLVSRGAQIDVKDSDGVSPLMLMLQRLDLNMLQIILNHHHLVVTAERTDFAASLLFSTVEYGVEEALRLVVEGGYAPVTVCNSKGETLLHRAIVKQNPAMVELVVELDRTNNSLTAPTLTGDSPAHYGARYGTARVMETLMQHLTRVFGNLLELDGAINPLNSMNHQGFTSLCVAATCGSIYERRSNERGDITRLLLQHGARLFSSDCVVIHSSPEHVLLHENVRRCMILWIQDTSNETREVDGGFNNGEHDADDDGQARIRDRMLTKFCTEWLTGVTYLPVFAVGQQPPSDFSAVLDVMISAGYAYDVIPLLLELPLLRTSTESVLHRLQQLARLPHEHSFLLELHAELSEALLET